MDENDRRIILVAMAAIGGAIVSVWSLPWKAMHWREIAFALVVGTFFGVFGVPLVVADMFHVDITPIRVACGTTFFGSAFGIGLIPLIRKKIILMLGLKGEAE